MGRLFPWGRRDWMTAFLGRLARPSFLARRFLTAGSNERQRPALDGLPRRTCGGRLARDHGWSLGRRSLLVF